MPLTRDPAIAAVLGDHFATDPALMPQVGDLEARRKVIPDLIRAAYSTLPELASIGVAYKDYYATAQDGHRILLRWYYKTSSDSDGLASDEGEAGKTKGKGSALVFLHGGGMVLGSVNLYDRPRATDLADTNLSGILSIEYRLAPEFPHPYPSEDSLAGLQ